MAKLVIEIEDATLAAALVESQDQQVSLDTLINETLRVTLSESKAPVLKAVDIDEILANAISRAKSLTEGSQFLLADLVPAVEWELIGSGERKSLGKGFRKAVEGATPQLARHNGRTSSNKAIYVRM